MNIRVCVQGNRVRFWVDWVVCVCMCVCARAHANRVKWWDFEGCVRVFALGNRVGVCHSMSNVCGMCAWQRGCVISWDVCVCVCVCVWLVLDCGAYVHLVLTRGSTVRLPFLCKQGCPLLPSAAHHYPLLSISSLHCPLLSPTPPPLFSICIAQSYITPIKISVTWSTFQFYFYPVASFITFSQILELARAKNRYSSELGQCMSCWLAKLLVSAGVQYV
jgi:hypothetical protein